MTHQLKMPETSCLKIASTLFILSILFVPIALSAAGQKTIEIVDATVDDRYDNLFLPQRRGWMGSDAAVSIPLSETKTVWLFGDTLLGQISSTGKRQGPMVRNSIAIHDIGGDPPGTVEFYWDLTDGITGDFFHPKDFEGDHWYWPGTGAFVDEELFLFLYKMNSTEGAPGFEFKMTDTTLVRVSNPHDSPHDWEMTYTDLGFGGSHVGINTACLVHDSHLYLLGFTDPESDPTQRAAILARIALDDLKGDACLEDFEFWTETENGEEWNSNPDRLKTLYTPGSTEASLEYDARLDRFIAVTHFPFQSGMYLASAPKLTGPWSEPVQVFEIPELAKDDNYHAYAMKSHPELTSASNELVITYVVNTKDFWSMFSDLDIYYPRFVRVRLK